MLRKRKAGRGFDKTLCGSGGPCRRSWCLRGGGEEGGMPDVALLGKGVNERGDGG